MLSQPNAAFGKQTSITYLPRLIHVQHSCQEKIGWRKDDTLLISNSACSKCKWKEWAPLTLHSPVYHWNKWSPGCDRVTFPTVWVMPLSWAEGQGESCDSKPLQLQSFLATTVNHSSGRDAGTLKLGCIRWPTSPTARQQRARSQCLGSAYCSRRPKQSKNQEPIEWKSFPHSVMGKWEERGSFALSASFCSGLHCFVLKTVELWCCFAFAVACLVQSILCKHCKSWLRIVEMCVDAWVMALIWLTAPCSRSLRKA